MLIRSRVILHARQQEQQELRDQQGLKRKRRYVAPIVPFYPFQTTGFEEPTFNPEHLRVLLEEFPQGATMSHAPDGTTMLETVLRINEKESDAYWENVNMVLKAAAYGTIKESELQSRGPFLLLHTFLELVCCVGPFQGWARDYSINFALDFIDWINDRQPIQFQRRDSDGNFPLHIAMQNTSMGRDYTSQLWTYLVEQCPESAGFADSEGRLALHQAITRRLDCIDILIEAEPRAVTTRDIATHMYPFEQVAYRLVAAQAPAPPAAPAGFMAQLSQEVEVEPAAAPPAVPAGFMAQQAVFQPQEVEVEPAAGPPAVPAGFMAQLFAQPGFRPRVVRPQANVSNPEDENTEALDLMYKLLRMAPHVARNSIRETYVDTPEYLEFQRNKLEMAQIELESYTKRKAIEKRNKELQRRFKLL